jgi:hypothetical protein
MRDVLRPELKKHGFTLKGRIFSWFDRGNWGLIEIQKGSTSTPDVLVFTINVGVLPVGSRV